MRIPKRRAEEDARAQKTFDPHVTPAKIQRLQDELLRLETTDRPHAIAEQQHAASMGDFSENAAYQEAKTRLRRINTRILVIKETLAHAIIIQPHTASKDIRLGSVVTVESANGKQTFEIVGQQETNPARGRISHLSPLGQKLLGRTIDDTVDVQHEQRTVTYRIIDVR